MFKKTLLSLAVASTVGLTGCFDDAKSGANANPDYKINNPAIDGKTWPIFNPITSELPIPNDLIFDSEQGDGTFGVADSSPPVTTALNELSGASTVAPAVIQFNGQIDASTVVYGQTVFLLELDYASGDPLQGLSIGEPPTVLGAAPARADVETLDGTSAIRILPLQPLNPRKRYVAVVTTDVTDISGEAIIQSPTYAGLTDEEQPLASSALAPVRTLINSLWEAVATAAIPGLTEDKIAISYSFTTSNDEKVLHYITEPAAWFADQLATFLKVSAASAAVEAGAGDFATVDAAVSATVEGFPSAELQAALSPIFDAPPCQGLTGQPAIDCVGFALANTPSASGGFADLLPTPAPQTVTLDLTGTNDVALASAPVAAAAGGAGNVNIVQGTITLPYYLGTPSGTNGSPIVTGSWVADDDLATQINAKFGALGLEIPQADPTVSTAVNYVFPFPKETATVEAPALILYPSGATSIDATVIFQHGITTDRSAALPLGSALVATLAGATTPINVAVISMDEPLHGVTPFSTESQEALAGALLEGAGQTNDETNRQALIDGTFSIGALMQIDAGCDAITVDFGDPARL